MAGITSGNRVLDAAELRRRAARAASGFDRLGVAEGDAIALLLRNDFAFFEASMAAALIGAYVVPVNWHFKAAEIGYILRDSDSKVLILHADLLQEASAAIPDGMNAFVVPVPPETALAYKLDPEACEVPRGHEDWDTWVAAQDEWEEPPLPPRTSILYTSGTTGNPKGVVRPPMPPEAAAVHQRALEYIFGLQPGKTIRSVLTGPVYHAAPNLYAMAAIATDGDVYLQAKFDAEELLRLIEAHRITHLHMVPTMFNRLLKLPQETRSKYDLSSLEWVVHGAAPCPPNIKRAMIDWWGPVIHEYYGGTETGAAVYHDSAEALAKPGTVGRAVPGTVLKVLDEHGQECPPGVAGDIYVMQPGFDGFTYKNQDRRRAEIERHGLVCIGDVGYLDEDGYLFLCDRSVDMVISGGTNIYPAEIEAVLLDMPGVRDCAVFGVPDEDFGEALCAHVDADPGLISSGAQVQAWLRERIANYKVPARVVFDDSLPREDSGKIMKRKIREQYWRDRVRNI